MNMFQHNQKGFSILELILVLLFVLAIGGAGYYVWQNRDKDSHDTTPSLKEPASPCKGRFYDSHAHPDDDAVLERLPEIMTTYDIGCSVLFTQLDITDIDNGLLEARESYAELPGRISIFYDIIDQDPSEVTRKKLDELYDKSNGKFAGFGEFAFYQEPLRGTSLEADPWSVIFEFAGEKGLPIMIHPQPELVPSLEAMLNRYPDTAVIVHGSELPDQMAGLLKEHPNLYYTLDTATMLVEGTPPLTMPLMYPGGGPNMGFDAGAFIAKYQTNKEDIIDQAVKTWLPVLEAAPGRVMWGTDISMEGHVDNEVYAILVEMTDAFVEHVPEQYRKGYLRDNAFDLLGAGQTLTAPSEAEMDRLDSGQDDAEDN